jgi:hypothetical protein
VRQELERVNDREKKTKEKKEREGEKMGGRERREGGKRERGGGQFGYAGFYLLFRRRLETHQHFHGEF